MRIIILFFAILFISFKGYCAVTIDGVDYHLNKDGTATVVSLADKAKSTLIKKSN